MPESFTAEKRRLLREEQEAEVVHSPAEQRGMLSKTKAMISATLHPLAFLWPPVDPVTEKRNLRVLWCAIHNFLASLGTGYISTAMLVFLTAKAHFKPDEVRLFRQCNLGASAPPVGPGPEMVAAAA